MAFDFKKEFKEFYLPPRKPVTVDLPQMQFVAMRGLGDPNVAESQYRRAVQVLYSVAYTIKMSKLSDHRIDGYFDYVLPPLESFWKYAGGKEYDPLHKDALYWTAVIRMPDFVTEEEFRWGVEATTRRKNLDCTGIEFFTLTEGLCVQCMHIGTYDSEQETVRRMQTYMTEQGLEADFSDTRLHHEIYLSDPRKTAHESLKTVLRLPVRRIAGDAE